MKDLNKKEERFSEILSGLSWDIDNNELWNDLEKQLPKEEKRRPIAFFWWTGFVLFFLLSIAGLSHLNSKSPVDQAIASNSVSETSFQLSQSEDIEDDKNASNSKTELLESESPSISNEIASNSLNKESSTIKKNVNSQSPHNKVVALSKKEEAASHQSMKSTSSQEKIDLGIKTSSPSTSIATIENDSPLLVSRDLLVFENIAKKEFNVLGQKRKLYPNAVEPIHRSRINDLLFMASAGSTLPKWDYSNSEGDFDLNGEESLLGFSTTLQIGKYLNRWFFIEGGLNLSEAVARYKNNNTSISTQNISGISRIDVNAFGQETTTLGSITETTINHSEIQWHRKHRSLQAFFGAGIDLLPQSNWIFTLNSSLQYNVWNQHSGYYLNEDLTSISRFTSNESHPYNNLSWNIGGGLRIGYQFNQLGIYVNSIFKNNLGSYTQDSNPFLINSSQIGLELGMVYRPHWE